MSAMPMPGGWTMSMTWMRMPGHTWSAAAASFLGMWMVMMVAMMLPTLMPRLWGYRQSIVRTDPACASRLTVLMATGYFCVWAVIGMATYLLGVLITGLEMHQPLLARAVPCVTGFAVLIIGVIQLTAWKARQLECCRARTASANAASAHAACAWRHGVQLGFQCSRCCANLMTIPLLIGIMDAGAMAAVGAAIIIERFAPAHRAMARIIGGLVIAAGLGLIVRAM
jgi:predicted metal-binding membrane protein